jgi:hypothetical protein
MAEMDFIIALTADGQECCAAPTKEAGPSTLRACEMGRLSPPPPWITGSSTTLPHALGGKFPELARACDLET